jgi:hypothetical protein
MLTPTGYPYIAVTYSDSDLSTRGREVSGLINAEDLDLDRQTGFTLKGPVHVEI